MNSFDASDCEVTVIDRDSRISVEVVHPESGVEVAIIGNGDLKDDLRRRALQRVQFHVSRLENHQA